MRVNFHATLRTVVGQKTVELPVAPGSCALELARYVANRWPSLADQIIDSEGDVSRQVHIMIGGRNIRWLPEGSATPIGADDVVDFFPPTAGG